MLVPYCDTTDTGVGGPRRVFRQAPMMTAKSDKCTQKPHRKLSANAQVMEPKEKEKASAG